jgi:hypothetical protein
VHRVAQRRWDLVQLFGRSSKTAAPRNGDDHVHCLGTNQYAVSLA